MCIKLIGISYQLFQQHSKILKVCGNQSPITFDVFFIPFKSLSIFFNMFEHLILYLKFYFNLVKNTIL